MEIDAADASRILGQLEAAGLVVWLDGGWGVDALLGYQTRPHQDLDLVIARDDLAAAQQTLAAAGFTHDPTAMPGCRPGWSSSTPMAARSTYTR